MRSELGEPSFFRPNDQSPEKPMKQLKKALAEYIAALEKSSSETTRAEDRNQYQQHLAWAALMFAALEKHQSVERLQKVIDSARRAYSLTYLNNAQGKAAEKAFQAFAAQVERTHPPPVAPQSEGKTLEMTPKEEKKRFEVQFELFPPHQGSVAKYEVCTLMGPGKAIVIATQTHTARKGEPIYRVVAVKGLEGEKPKKKDLVDRFEW